MANPELIEQRLQDHMASDKEKFEEIDGSLKHIFKCLDNLRDNHVAHLQKGINEIKEEMQGIKSDVKWIKGIGAAVLLQAIAFIGDFISRLF